LLLTTLIIGAAAVLKFPELLGSSGQLVRGQALVAAPLRRRDDVLAVKFLPRCSAPTAWARSGSTASARAPCGCCRAC
jgi:hypothetical protein